MKTLFYGGLFLLVVGFIFNSCTKTMDKSEINESNSENNLFYKASVKLLCCDIARKKYDCLYGAGLCNCKVFPNCDPETEQMGTILSTNDSTLTLISNIGFSPEVDDTLYFDEDLVLPDDFAKEYGFSSITIKEGLYSVNQCNDESTCVVDVVLIE